MHFFFEKIFFEIFFEKITILAFFIFKISIKKFLDIDLQHCMIEELSPKLFKDNKQLEELSLAYNEIRSVPG